MSTTLGFRPLYQQVYDLMVTKISDGEYRPGEMLPSEQQLAGQLKVSQGTVRKALDTMTSENILERRQGKGTFVSEQTPERSTLRFFGFSRPDGTPLTPQNGEESIRKRKGTAKELRQLDTDGSEDVYEISRTRLIENKPAIIDKIVVSAKPFQGLQEQGKIGTALYTLFQEKYGIHVISTNDEISAIVASKADAKKISVEVGAPLLMIQRSTFDIHKKCVEFRITKVNTQGIIYTARI